MSLKILKYCICIEWCSMNGFCFMYRIDLEHLNSPEDAVRIVRETQSVEGAKMVAKWVTCTNLLLSV